MSWLDDLVYKIVDPAKQHNPKTFDFWLKQLLHLVGGGLIAAPFIFDRYICLLVALFISSCIMMKELGDPDHQSNFKGFIDWLAWSAGAGAVVCLTWILT